MNYRQRKARKARHQGKLGTKLVLGFGVLLAVVLIGALSAVGYIVSIAATAPDINDLKPIDKGASSEIFAADGSRLGYVQSDEIRTPISWEDMPVALRQATVSIEDKRFYEHHGVDYEGIVRAGWKNLTSGKTVQAARRSPSSSSARSTSRTRSATSSARSARRRWPPSSRSSTRSAGS